jgi:hypothetical protein
LASAFEHYLRTGRSVARAVETKFNPWHDPDDGRFTFAGQGQYSSGAARRQRNNQSRVFRGGGGSFGGGGAAGSWAITKPAARGRPGSGGGGGARGSWSEAPSPKPPSRPARPTSEGPARSQAPTPIRRPAEPRLTVRRDGYEFSIDAHARTRRVTGEIRLESQPRSRTAQANAGKSDRRGTDDGGHYIAARFNGPRDWFNHFAQDANFNRGVYRSIEDTWAKAVRSGKQVFVEIVPHYHGTSMRPYLLMVRWTIDGDRFSRDLPNEKQGK